MAAKSSKQINTVTFVEFLPETKLRIPRQKSAQPKSPKVGKISLARPDSIVNYSRDNNSFQDGKRGDEPSKTAFQMAEEMDLIGESKIFSDLSILRRHIDENLQFPFELAELGIEGRTTLDITIKKEGDMIIHQISGENTVLNINLHYQFIQIFQKPLPRFLQAEEVRILCHINFAIIHSELDRENREIPQFKNILNFERKAKLDSKVMQEVTYWTSRLPIKPSPIGPIFDFAAIYTLFKDQVAVDPSWMQRQRVLQNIEMWSREVTKFQDRKI